VTDRLYSPEFHTVIERIDTAAAPQGVFDAFEIILADVGAEYFGANLFPDADEGLDDVCIGLRIPSDWHAHYAGDNLFQRDPAIRHARHTVLPFDWASAPYDPATEGDMKAVIDQARDFNMDKGLIIPIPSPRGNIGNVWIGGPDFDDRETHQPLLYVVALHVFIRLQQLVGRNRHPRVHLTDREREVLAWASEGKTAWEIGRILNISHRTVEWHFGQACKKLGATNRSQAVAMLGARRELLEQEA
jgi:LuxR family transcriptional regulator, quorum-sensing system regulator BjaR1